MKIKIISDIKDPKLVTHWKRIVKEYNYFPQSSYGWCLPWWELRSGKRDLYVITVVDDTEKNIIGIAPFCIERHFIFSILRSFPIHFGDFFTFLVNQDQNEQEIFYTILEHLQSFKKWHLVRMDQVSSSDTKMTQYLHEHQFTKKQLTDVIVANFNNNTYDNYIQSLSKNKRQLIRKKRRKIEKKFPIELVTITDMKGYLAYFDSMCGIYNNRWGQALSDEYYECRNKAVASCFEEGTIVLFILKAQEEPIAFFLGFTNGSTFYEWKISHHPKYSVHSPGTLIRAYAIEYLIDQNFTQLNFMAGGYDYKKAWAPKEPRSTNYSYFKAKHSVPGIISQQYYLQWRDKVKILINKLPSKSSIKK